MPPIRRDVLDRPARPGLPAAWLSSGGQFLRFGIVGVAGFGVDASVLAAALTMGSGVYWGRALSYVAAATCTWALNRHWTFRDRTSGRVSQWARFLAVNALGGAMNYGVYALLVRHTGDRSVAFPVFAAAVGSLCGLAFNFMLSKRLVFRPGSAG
jgi:putative flippase GtrA